MTSPNEVACTLLRASSIAAPSTIRSLTSLDIGNDAMPIIDVYAPAGLLPEGSDRRLAEHLMQAAMRAERRVAEAALEAARAQLGRTGQEQAKLAEQIAALGDGSEQMRAREEAETKAAAAAKTLETP